MINQIRSDSAAAFAALSVAAGSILALPRPTYADDATPTERTSVYEDVTALTKRCDALLALCTEERKVVDQYEKKFNLPASATISERLAEFAGFQRESNPLRDKNREYKARDLREFAGFLETLALEQREQINSLQLVNYSFEKENYRREVREYQRKMAERAPIVEILGRRESMSGVGRNCGSPKSSEWITISDDALGRYDHEEHFSGFVKFFGDRPNNLSMLITGPNGERETGRMLPNNPDAPRTVVRVPDGAKVNGVFCYCEGEDFDGWIFTTTTGDLSVRLAGGENGRRFSLPALPEGFGWELCAIQIEGGNIDHANLRFRARFLDKGRSLEPAPEEPKAPTAPKLFDVSKGL